MCFCSKIKTQKDFYGFRHEIILFPCCLSHLVFNFILTEKKIVLGKNNEAVLFYREDIFSLFFWAWDSEFKRAYFLCTFKYSIFLFLEWIIIRKKKKDTSVGLSNWKIVFPGFPFPSDCIIFPSWSNFTTWCNPKYHIYMHCKNKSKYFVKFVWNWEKKSLLFF